MTRVCIHQPDFAPWLGFFDRLLDSDVFIVLDDAQFQKNGWNNRDKIKTKNGPAWLSLSLKKGPFPQKINDVQLDDDERGWKARNLNLITENYKTAPEFDRTFPDIKRLYEMNAPQLVDFNMAFIRYILGVLRIDVDIHFSSKMDIGGDKTDRLVELVDAVGGTHYVAGTGSGGYLETEKFVKRGISIELRPYQSPTYSQLFEPFVANLSTIDLLLNCGGQAADILRSAHKQGSSVAAS
jgi:hypothetical protein